MEEALEVLYATDVLVAERAKVISGCSAGCGRLAAFGAFGRSRSGRSP